ncbi:MAG TPA: hypothetical protein VEG84_01385, partial [Thermoanaerobaculia bacterium]|nr:hypothetical protein [Thermoanaerobaculia bacterium]
HDIRSNEGARAENGSISDTRPRSDGGACGNGDSFPQMRGPIHVRPPGNPRPARGWRVERLETVRQGLKGRFDDDCRTAEGRVRGRNEQRARGALPRLPGAARVGNERQVLGTRLVETADSLKGESGVAPHFPADKTRHVLQCEGAEPCSARKLPSRPSDPPRRLHRGG